MARGAWYTHSKQAVKDKQVAMTIEQWHEMDDTLGHRKLASLLHDDGGGETVDCDEPVVESSSMVASLALEVF
jgi:hypothetical protein